MFKSDSLAKLAPALLKAQKNMGAALKDAKNPFFKSKFADLNSVIDAAIPVLNEQGIVVLQSPTTVDTFASGRGADSKPVIETILLHESGEYISSVTDIVCAKANDPQAYGSAVSYARRYGLQATVTLKATDDDGEASMNRTTKNTSGYIAPVVVADGSAITITTTTATGTEYKTDAAPKKKVSFSKKSFAKAAETGDEL